MVCTALWNEARGCLAGAQQSSSSLGRTSTSQKGRMTQPKQDPQVSPNLLPDFAQSLQSVGLDVKGFWHANLDPSCCAKLSDHAEHQVHHSRFVVISQPATTCMP